jgi:hypothetical protein
LLAELKDGSKVTLNIIGNDKLAKIDGDYLVTKQGDSVAIEFEALPEDTIKTSIIATGYYDYQE